MRQDKRQFRRIPIGASVKIQELSFQQGAGATSTVYKDVSAGGLLIESAKAIALGTILKLEIKIPGWGKTQNRFATPAEGEEVPPMVAVGKVVRLEELDGDEGFEVGVKFTKVAPDDLEALLKFINSAHIKA